MAAYGDVTCLGHVLQDLQDMLREVDNLPASTEEQLQGQALRGLAALRATVQSSPKDKLSSIASRPEALELKHRCILCGFWTPDHTKMKNHQRQAHAQVWQRDGPAALKLCQAYTVQMIKGHPCPFCKLQVYDKRKHPEQCIVLFQVLFGWHKASLVYKLPTDAPLAQALAKAVAAWQKGHTPGKAHPLGSCAHFTAGAMLVQLAQSQQKPPGIDTAQFKAFIKLVEDFGESPHEAVIHLASARQRLILCHAAFPIARSHSESLPASLPPNMPGLQSHIDLDYYVAQWDKIRELGLDKSTTTVATSATSGDKERAMQTKEPTATSLPSGRQRPPTPPRSPKKRQNMVNKIHK
ncbi:unnamed protein product [Symbiodinium sp. CCMP2592]|nr:unnamed protein product [Symbiodinium sp. CCMP2592]